MKNPILPLITTRNKTAAQTKLLCFHFLFLCFSLNISLRFSSPRLRAKPPHRCSTSSHCRSSRLFPPLIAKPPPLVFAVVSVLLRRSTLEQRTCWVKDQPPWPRDCEKRQSTHSRLWTDWVTSFKHLLIFTIWSHYNIKQNRRAKKLLADKIKVVADNYRRAKKIIRKKNFLSLIYGRQYVSASKFFACR